MKYLFLSVRVLAMLMMIILNDNDDNLCFSRYGVGMIYYKQEKYNLAEVHFKKALTINPSSSVLLCHIGVVTSPLSFIHYLTMIFVVVSINLFFVGTTCNEEIPDRSPDD